MKNITALPAALLLGASLSVGTAQAADEAECIAPAKPGGGYDLTCRLAANGLLETGLIEDPMLVTYMPGGIGAVAYNHVNGVRTDDPNLIVAASTGAAVNLALGKFGQYDASEVRWVGALGVDYGAIVVKADAPWQTLDELMTALQEDPTQVAFGAGGSVGSQDWMKAALTAKAADVDPRSLRYVAFEGGGEALAALLGNHIQVFSGDLSELKSQLESGDIRVLAALSEERMGGPYAEIPTAAEQGYDVQWPIWRGYYMGPEVSDEAYQAWVERLENLAGNETFAELREARGLFPMARFGDDFDGYVKDQVAGFKELATEVGLTQ
ncbi:MULTISPECIES: tripartite tricarboxylate transporter substrate-binding protein [unclassified Halomonas]|uniref:Tripartite tricarboxylate transporter substrate-binding protein n=2 Tax=unclassified Halomonas TaxID=2609666 RepID=A0AAU7KG14_9GAMM|nr:MULTISPECIES: tripartite tricarboxylate transporter substrate-binding protein [unclassified Halomonas]MBR9880443.1 tripartite tricarboxylate transporter substrate binding protein [Gammaproteobacteria bacterium]MAR74429.1 tricarboxylic transporter [Halomonas sp.]MBY5943336.1 tripartite tricarboxylate transporter substrate binding protein [Halomonas sp. DP5N14-9]MCO7215740.1 tripartite tricarboxylate transporter substrate-binding protein [Halomonas sp. OfavH-34-E]RQW72014.1 tripartite tricarb|tara:strand:- start:399 stop:1373 length:975 start_codon:yes stop_codon:yes gene_type:complete